MQFNTPVFTFLFLPLFFLLFLIARKRIGNGLLNAASLVFYSWAAPVFVFVMLASVTLDWILCRKVSLINPERRKAWTVFGIALNCALLLYFKYMNFFIGNVNEILLYAGLKPLGSVAVLMPLGLSYLVFQKISYLVDVYRGDAPPARFRDYVLYVFLFPKILAGPIVKYREIFEYLPDRVLKLEGFVRGLSRFSLGLLKKVYLAETLAEVANFSFSLTGNDLGLFNAWMGAIAFTFQIYFDFSSYSDMAIGLLKMMGFDVPENFNMPYISRSITEFWRRWHISLSTWIRDYLYISLGGNRAGRARMYVNLWVCFLISGLWHGANWTFVIWGIYHGSFIVMEKVFLLRMTRRTPGLVKVAVTFFIVLVGWVIFRADSAAHAFFYLSCMFGPAGGGGTFFYFSHNVIFFLALALFLSFAPLSPLYGKLRRAFEKFSWRVEIELAAALVFLLLSLARMASMTFNPFLYIRF